MKLYSSLLLIIFLLTTGLANAQEQKQKDKKTIPFKDRVFFGGNVGLEISRNFFLDLSPSVGYMLTNEWSAGIGVSYQYFKAKELPGFSTYGGRLFTRYQVYDPFFLYGEYENLNIVDYNTYNVTDEQFDGRQWLPGLFLGGGILQSLGGRIGLSLTAMYNMLYDPGNTVYARPYVIRMGFVIMPKR